MPLKGDDTACRCVDFQAMDGRQVRAGLGALGALALLAPAAASAAPSVTGEFPLPVFNNPPDPPVQTTVGSNEEIAAGPDGNLWVATEQNTVVRMKPDGSAEAFVMAGMTAPAKGLIAGPDGNLWGAQGTSVIKIPPDNPGAASQTSITGLAGGQGITVGPDGNIWVAGTNALVKIPPAAPSTYTVFDAGDGVTLGAPKGMTTASDGLIWVADGKNVVSATAANPPVLTTTPVNINPGQGNLQDVGAGLNGQVAYANPGDDPQNIGLFSPGGQPQKIPLENTDPFGVAFGQDQAYWIARAQGNDLVRLTADGQFTTLTGFAPSGGVGPRKITTGPGNTLWVTLDTPEKVARVSGVEAPPATGGTPPETKLKKPKRKFRTTKRKAKVKIKFSSAAADPSFACTLKRKGGKQKTKACTSPATYKLKPGKYAFSVVATSAGVTDASPATAKFKVVRKTP